MCELTEQVGPRVRARASSGQPAPRPEVRGTRCAWWLAAVAGSMGCGSFAHALQDAQPQEPTPADALAKEPEAKAEAGDTPVVAQIAQILISKFDARYLPEPHPKLPPIEDLLDAASLSLVNRDGRWFAPAPGEAAEALTVGELNRRLAAVEGGVKFSKEAVIGVLIAIRDALTARDLIGVLAEIDQNEIEQDPDTLEWTDGREEGATRLSVNVYAATVTRVRTIAAGQRIEGRRTRIDLPEHESIRKSSPLTPVAEGAADRNDLLVRESLDEYVLRLNRRAGRRVDVAISGDDADRPGSVLLDYLVRETDPLLVYIQGSNTGTKQTNIWRERVGLIHNQITGNDDTLSLDYVTGGFESTHIFNGSYEVPLDDEERLKVRAYGSFSQYDASEVGRSNERFTGDEWLAGGEISLNVFQAREVFIDLFAGAKFQHVFVENNTNPAQPIRGETDFVLPIFGARLDRLTDEANTIISLAFQANLPHLAGTDPGELQRLGRLGTDTNWQTIQFSAEQTFFLEPLLDRDAFLRGESTLAHEVSVTFKGQTAFGYRLAPNFQQVAGGLYTVRGYPESAASGDNVYVGTVEYRLHVPRMLAVQTEPGEVFGEPFRWAPQQPYARPDWDLIVRTFVDAGRTENNQAAVNEFDQTLVGVGVGIELQFRRNLNVRVDYGVALQDVKGSSGVDRGDGRLHFVGTLLF
ncbi:MAG: hypothetical protein ACKVS8_05910 [Phycisphaerales bacterium]